MHRRTGLLTTAALVLATLVRLVLPATDAAASHVSALSSGGEQMLCYACHNLSGDVNLGYDPATNYINQNSRTLSTMKILNGGATPGIFGCTYCHSDATRTAKMKDAMGDFATQTSMHYVGKQRTSGTQTWNEYVSNRTGNAWNGTPIADELQCVYCHDTALVDYPESSATPTPFNDHAAAPATNQNRLRGFVSTSPFKYNDSCVNTCHDGDYEGTGAPTNLPNGEAVPRMGHYGWGSYVQTGSPATTVTMREPRGTSIQEVRCEVCHDTHSSNKASLFSDGTEDTAINENNCTAVCHSGGLATSGYRTKGHGKAMNRENTVAIGFSYTTCAPCHNTGVPHRDPANPQRFGLTDDTNQAGITYNGAADGLDNNMNGQVDEAAEATWTNSATSICRTCHSTYNVHSGAIAGGSGRGSASCLDCHDPHGEAVGANVEMIRSSVVGEPTTYVNPPESASPDFFRAGDATGACDNIACHGKALGNDTTAGTILGDVSAHQGVAPGTNCISCHVHSSPSGAASFAPNCNVCHGYPPTAADTLADNTNAVGVHNRHVTELGYGCSECHFNTGNQHNESLWTSYPGFPVPTANVDVVFSTHGATANTTATYDPATHTCRNVTCHNPDSSTPGEGLTGKAGANTDNNPLWVDAFAPIATCTACHVQSPATNPDGGSHYRHDNTAQRGYPCEYCHSGYSNQGTHANFVLNTTNVVVLAGTLGPVAMGGTYADATRICSGVYCHGTTLAAAGSNTAPTWGTAATGACGTCHDNDTADTTPATRILTGNHTTHVDPVAAPYGPRAACTDCHAPTTSAQHVNGIKDFKDGNPLSAPATNACDACHNGSPTTAKSEWTQAAGHWRTVTGGYCEHCHDATPSTVNTLAGTGGVNAVAADKATYFTSTGHGSAAAYNATLHNQAGPGYTCAVTCHVPASAHIDGTAGNTDRLRPASTDALAYTTTNSEFCLDCHRVGKTANGTLGFDAVAEATVHSGGVNSRYNTAAAAPTAFPRYGDAAGYAANPGYQCNACHDPHGTAKLAMVKPTISGGTGWPTTTIAGFGSASADLSGLDPTTAADSGVCDACHASAASTHPDTTPPSAGPNGNHNQGDTGDSCMKCHNHAQSFRGSCTDCHGNPANAAYGGQATFWPDGSATNNGAKRVVYADDELGSHAEHIATLQAREGYTLSTDDQIAMCAWCHPSPGGPNHDANGGGDSRADVNGPAIPRIDGVANKAGAADAYLAPSYSTAALTCANVDCHYNTTTPAYAGLGWNGGDTNTSTCTICHAATAGYVAASLPNAHDTHVGGKGLACTQCHPNHLADYEHLNGTVQVVFDNTNTLGEPGLVAPSAAGSDNAVKYGVLAGTYATCSALYCHGNDVYEAAGGFQLAGGTLTTPRWNFAVDGNCGTCHDTGTQVGETSPATALASGNHTDHLSAAYGPNFGTAALTACDQCHPVYAVGSASHVNGTRDFQNNNTTVVGVSALGLTAPAAAPDATSTDRCNQCHSTAAVSGSVGTVLAKTNWATGAYLLPCLSCHNAADPAMSQVGGTGVAAPAKDAYYALNNGGHGFTGTSTGTGNAMPSYGCAVCHAPAAAHISGVLDDADRLPGGLTANTDCADCHAVGQTAPGPVYALDATVEASNHASSVTGRYAVNPAYNYACVACHDPHGTSNIAMVNTTIVDGMGATATAVTLSALTNLDPTNAADNGVCDRCHADAGQSHANTAHPNNHNWGGTGNACVTCHQHTKSFTGSCTDCHGNPANAAYANQATFWPDAVANNPSRVGYADDEIGSHAEHIAVLQAKEGFTLSAADQIAMCNYCHPVSDSGHIANNAPLNQVDVDTAGMLRIDGVSNKTGSPDLHTAPTYNTATKTCGTVDCHYETTTPAYGGLGWDGADDAGNVTNCTTCHADGAAAYTAAQLPNAHDTHVDEAPTGRDLACTQCHPDHLADVRHLNGAVDFSFATALGEPGAVAGTQAGSDAAVKYGALAGTYSTCSNFYCHGADLPGAAGTDITPTWNQSTTGNCGTCHDTGTQAGESSPATALATGNHTDHLSAAYGPNFGTAALTACDQCHPVYAVGGGSHVNGTKDFQNNDVAPNPVSQLGLTAPALDPPTTSTDRCNQCHSTAAVSGSVGTVLAKTNWATGAYLLPCLSCHNAADPAMSQVGGTGVAAPAKDAYYALNNGGHGYTGTSTATGNAMPSYGCEVCHAPAAAHISGALNDSDRLPGGLTQNTACADCHAPGQAAPGPVYARDAAVEASNHATTVTGSYASNPAYNYACVACHDPHGTSNIAMINTTIVDNMGAAAAGVTIAAETGLDPVGADNGVCDRCHADAGLPHASTNHPDNHNQGSTCLTCHNHEVSFQGSCTSCHGDDTAKTIWPDGVVGNNPSRVAYADDAPGAHAKHIALLRAKEGYSLTIADQQLMCAYCHANPGAAGHEANNAPLNQVDVDPTVFKRIDPTSNRTGTADAHTAATYSTAAKTCGTTDCHYETTTPGWESGTVMTCTSCHAGDAPYTAGTLPNAHDLHANETANAGYNYACTVCHASGTYTLTHLDGDVAGDVSFAGVPWGNDADEAVASGDGLVKYGAGADANYYTCANISCHGDYPGGNTANLPRWNRTDAALGATNGDANCGSCHGTDVTKDPQPVYVDTVPKANKHPKHHTENGYGCQVCHWPTTTTGTTITTRPNHANGTFNVDDDAVNPTLDSFTFAGGVAGTCNVTECHGGGSVNWNGATQIACNVCHGQVAGAVTNTDVNNFAWDNATQSKVSDSEYLNGGHGDSAPRVIAKACSACHDSAAAHDITPALTGTNPWRLRDLDGVTAGLQFSCSSTAVGCHVAGISGPQTGLPLTSIVTHSNEAMTAAGGTPKRAWPATWDPQCVNCHDPHGDGANLSMVQREIYDKAAFPLPAGVPAPPTEQTSLVFSDNTTGASAAGTSYADLDAPFSSVCQECHEDPGVVSFRDNATASGANHPSTGANPGDCSNCHKHDSAFKPSGCYGCHGNTVSKSYWPDQAAYPDTAGAHLNHVNTIGAWLYGETDASGLLVDNANGSSDTKQKAVCAWCHPNPGNPRGGTGEGSHDAGATPADVHGDGRAGATVTYQQYTGLAAPAAVNDVDATYTAATHTCNASNCHNQVATPDWNAPPAWTSTSCATLQCHSTSAASGKHLTHYGPAAKAYGCDECHVVTTNLRHLNGQVNLAWTAGLESDGDGFYDHDATATATPADNNFAPAYDGGAANSTCYNMYCHGDFTGGNAANLPTWNGLAACGTCHGGTTATMTNGSHTTHFDATWGANLASCLACHTNYLLTTATHADGVKTVVASGVSATASTLAATAVCNACHGITTYDTEVIKANWPDAAVNTYTPGSANPDVTCESCHGGGDTPATQNANGTGGVAPAKTASFATRGHGLPVGSTYAPSGRTGAGASCLSCHNSASAHLSATNGDTDRLATAGNPLCTNCHDGTADGAGNKSAVRVSTHANTSATMTALAAVDRYTAQRPQFELNCVECHDVHGTPTNIYMVTPANPNGPLVAPRLYNGAANTTNFLFNSGAVAFTANAAGADFATTAANATKICQTCHTATGGATAVYRHNAATTGHDTAACIQCHAHDIDATYTAASQDGFMPRKNCMNCHNGSTTGPNVMTYWFGSNATKQDGGHGDPEGRDGAGPVPVCADCHDPSIPAGTHLDGTYNSLTNNSTRNANTSHLKAEYFVRSSPPSIPVSAGTWSTQVYFDNYCAEKCHTAKGVPAMTHERDTLAADGNHWSVEFGTHMTTSDGDSIIYPVDADLNTGANAADVDYAPCISCHDPHGTGVVEPTKSSNRMVRDSWITAPTLCNVCHN
jgi:predicted CxxxxCH...CXXCH cytochrome family protein